jgi:hypothetical protein
MSAGKYIWLIALTSVVLVLVVDEQENSRAGKPAAVEESASLFRANYSPCYGLRA